MELRLVVVVAMAVGLIVVGLIGPLIAQRRLRRLHDATADERERLAAVAPNGHELPPHVAIIETVGEASIEVALRGPPGHRVLFITDYVLTDLDEPIARALIAAEHARTDRWYREYQVVAAAIALTLGLSAFLALVPFELGFGGLLLAAAVMLAGGRWLQYRADAAAAATVGADAVADAFEHVAEMHGHDLERGGWRSYLEVQPPLADRIHRLRHGD